MSEYENRLSRTAMLENLPADELLIHEIYFSVQGESTHAGRRCVFVRTAICNLRCTYCDTAYAFTGGQQMTLEEILLKVKSFDCELVEITGGEPLLQAGATKLSVLLISNGFEVLIETGGSLDISVLPAGVRRILDIKTPGSGEVEANLLSNLQELAEGDEIKFVVTGKADFDWAIDFVQKHNLTDSVPVLISPCQPQVNAQDCANWVKECGCDVRLNLQLHKFIWPASKRGV